MTKKNPSKRSKKPIRKQPTRAAKNSFPNEQRPAQSGEVLPIGAGSGAGAGSGEGGGGDDYGGVVGLGSRAVAGDSLENRGKAFEVFRGVHEHSLKKHKFMDIGYLGKKKGALIFKKKS
jgi:hypothetical protein